MLAPLQKKSKEMKHYGAEIPDPSENKGLDPLNKLPPCCPPRACHLSGIYAPHGKVSRQEVALPIHLFLFLSRWVSGRSQTEKETSGFAGTHRRTTDGSPHFLFLYLLELEAGDPWGKKRLSGGCRKTQLGTENNKNFFAFIGISFV
ncbi:MAG: hypothetical protein JWP69_1316 [Flaviaesturariibacter sp.]|nr:hypothetical protein [Flaviaesturariibacter sp.]